MSAKKRGLGRGLDSLLSSSLAAKNTEQEAVKEQPVDVKEDIPVAAPQQNGSDTHDKEQLRNMPVDIIKPGKYQPRMDMRPETLEELAESIKAQGLMQPIVVRPVTGDMYEIIAGERRWRACQMAGIDRIPVLVRNVEDDAAIAMALIENIQRENLNPIEEAMALKRLQDEFALTQQEVAEAVGKSRTTVTNLLRLMGLTPEVRTFLEHGDLEMGHARALLALKEEKQAEAARNIIGRGLSVRQAEALVRHLQSGKQKSKTGQKLDPDIRHLQDSLSEKLGSPVMIQHTAKGKGRLVLKYNSLDELDGILAHIK
jgi:ParB family chromosome partitioning protein